MPTLWTADDILAMAPDTQVAESARGLARPDKWEHLFQDEQTLWGECPGSGAAPYRVAIDVNGQVFKCTCPSRKRPCKHALGLFLLAQAEPQAVRPGEPPEWVRQWVAGRAAQAAKAARPAGPAADALAQERRAEQRKERVQQGVHALSLWLEDLVRRGLGSLQSEPPDFWEAQAARLVDAQAPGLARRVRSLAFIPVSGSGWPERLLAELCRLHLLLEAFERLETLPPGWQEEVRAQIGWAQDQGVLRQQPGERDRWLVLAQRESQEDRLRVRHHWLWGAEHQRAALLLDFAAPGKPFGYHLASGVELDAELVFWPGSLPLRALIKAQHAALPMRSLCGYPSIGAALAAYSVALARNPWLERFLVPLEQAVPEARGEGWIVRDAQDRLLPLAISPGEGWRLLALSGGYPLTLIGEWDGRCLDLLSVWTGEELVAVEGQSENVA